MSPRLQAAAGSSQQNSAATGALREALDDKLSSRVLTLTDAVAYNKEISFVAMEELRRELHAGLDGPVADEDGHVAADAHRRAVGPAVVVEARGARDTRPRVTPAENTQKLSLYILEDGKFEFGRF